MWRCTNWAWDLPEDIPADRQEDTPSDRPDASSASSSLPSFPSFPNTSRFLCYAFHCSAWFNSDKERKIHARENIDDPDHCASYLYCLAPSREKNRPDGICDYSRTALFKPDELGTHLREKNLKVERSAGVIRHVHLTQLERDGYQYIALEINRAARLGLGRSVPRTTRARPTEKNGKVFFATKEVEDLLAKYQDFQKRQSQEKPQLQLQEQQPLRAPMSFQAYLEADDDPESLFVPSSGEWWPKEDKELDDMGPMPPAQ